ncbi:MAG TPA: adenylate/guanylate cyclase domain-containing protein [Actinoplanes sp.]|jgi:class 3 adenylate cyclase|nr:adenylate/guanylate cyclase domain-containing protein [Actinoplanes sp.]
MIDHIGQTGPRRRQVAVLFADICGFTRLVESVEPEAVYRIMRPLLDELVARVHEHGGEIQQVLGDGFMAVFGLRRAYGDETERATAAACAMLRGVRPGRPEIHVGIECGEVLVTRSWEPAGFGVWGRAVNLAQRMCGVAGPGELVLGPAAYARSEHLAAPATAASVRVRGVADPVAAHRVVVLPAMAAALPVAA